MVKASTKIPQMQQLSIPPKIMKKTSKKSTPIRRQRSLPLSLSRSLSSSPSRASTPPSNFTEIFTSTLPFSPSSSSSLSLSPQSQALLRRAISDPVPYLSNSCSEDIASASKRIRRMMVKNEESSSSGNLSPSLPPRPMPEFLTRTVSDHATLLSDSTSNSNPSTSKRMMVKNEDSSSSGYLPPPPLPPRPSPEFLRRTVSDPVTLLSNSPSNSNASTSKEMKMETQKVTLSGEGIMVKCNCKCGKTYRILVNAADNKCHLLV